MIRFFRVGLALILCAALALSVPVSLAQDDVTEIYTAAQLSAIRDDVGGNYRLMADITFTEADFAEGGAFYNAGAGWDPIGKTYATRFTGELDGNGHTVSGLQINITESAGQSTIYGGMFAQAAGTIKDLTMVDTRITVGNSQYANAAPIAAAGMGDILNCRAEDTVITVKNISVTARAGGIVGYCYKGTVDGCVATGSIDNEAMSPLAGGIAGQSGGALQRSMARMSLSIVSRSDCYAGGIVANNSGTVSACLSDCVLRAESAADGNIGGIVGISRGAVRDCLALGEQIRLVSHYDNYGGVCGVSQSTVANSYY
ncbi:MAG: hypothetical protein ACOYJY_06720, partial [Acutalibacteraceae bacterium]